MSANPAPVPAPGSDAACDLCKLQSAMKRIMDDIETLPEIGAFYDDQITAVFNAADDAYCSLSHEHGLDAELSDLTMRPRQDAPERGHAE